MTPNADAERNGALDAGRAAQHFASLDVAVDQLEQTAVSLEQTAAHLEQTAVSDAAARKAIEVVRAVGRLTAGEAWDVLREVSMHTNIKVRHVAELITEWGRTGELCADIRTELERGLAERRREAAQVAESPHV